MSDPKFQFDLLMGATLAVVVIVVILLIFIGRSMKATRAEAESSRPLYAESSIHEVLERHYVFRIQVEELVRNFSEDFRAATNRMSVPNEAVWATEQLSQYPDTLILIAKGENSHGATKALSLIGTLSGLEDVAHGASLQHIRADAAQRAKVLRDQMGESAEDNMLFLN